MTKRTNTVLLRSPHGGRAQVGTADDPKDVNADGIVALDPDADAVLIDQLIRLHGFEVVEK